MKKVLLSVMALCSVGIASAVTYDWVDWTNISAGVAAGNFNTTPGPITVNLTGPFTTIYTNYPSWTPASSYADGSIVSNSPDNTSLVRVDGTGTFSLQFSQPIYNLAFSVWSVGNGSQPVTYTFDHPLVFNAGGPGAEYGGQSITTGPFSLNGVEGNGTVLFPGPLTSLVFSVDQPEGYHGFNFGVPANPVPEPSTILALGAGLALVIRRRRKA